MVLVLALSTAIGTRAAVPPPGSTYHHHGYFSDSGRGAYTGAYMRRPDQWPTGGLTSDCNAGLQIPIYYPAWVIIGADDWVEIGTAFYCTTNWSWYQGWSDFQGFHWRGEEFQQPLGSHIFQIYRVGEVYHWDIDGIEYVVPMFWNAVGNRVEAGIESYNSLGITNYVTHDTMNVTLSESPWTGFQGVAFVTDGGVRMCSVPLSQTSFKARQKSSGTQC